MLVMHKELGGRIVTCVLDEWHSVNFTSRMVCFCVGCCFEKSNAGCKSDGVESN